MSISESGARSAFMEVTGLDIDEVTPSRVSGSVLLGPQHHQPYGIVHGGVYAAIVEEAASMGGAAAAEERGLGVVGVHNSTHFLRAVSSGRVHVEAAPIQQGRTQQLWEVRITDDDDRLVALGQLRLQNVDRSRF
jgi:1,4-dihydroxy-2-naphthoyl-CoA hydrolase